MEQLIFYTGGHLFSDQSPGVSYEIIDLTYCVSVI